MSAFGPDSLFQMVMETLTYIWPLLTAAMLVAGVLVIKAKLFHPGWAIVIGGTLCLVVSLWRIGRMLNLLDLDSDIWKEHLMISQMISFVGNGLMAYGMLVLGWIVLRQQQEGRFGHRED